MKGIPSPRSGRESSSLGARWSGGVESLILDCASAVVVAMKPKISAKGIRLFKEELLYPMEAFAQVVRVTLAGSIDRPGAIGFTQ